MGAANFHATGLGKTAGEAFDLLVRQDQHENGHSYSGGIGMKYADGFHLVPLPKGVTVDAVERRLFDAAQAIYAIEDQRQGYGHGEGPTADERKALRWMREKFGPQADRLVMAWDDKWAACLAFELRGAERAAVLRFEGVTRTTRKAFAFLGHAAE